MKKLILVVLSVILCMSVTACRSNNRQSSDTATETDIRTNEYGNDIPPDFPVDPSSINNIAETLTASTEALGCKLTVSIDTETYKNSGIILAKTVLDNTSDKNIVLYSSNLEYESENMTPRMLGEEYIDIRMSCLDNENTVYAVGTELRDASDAITTYTLKPGEYALYFSEHMTTYVYASSGIERAPDKAEWKVCAKVFLKADDSYDSPLTPAIVEITVPH